MKFKYLVGALLLFLFPSNCAVNEKDVNGFVSKFTLNRNKFEKLVSLIRNERYQVDHAIHISHFSPDVKKLSDELGIIEIIVSSTNCNKGTDYELSSSWNKSVSVNLIKTD